MALKEVDLELTGESLVADRGDDLYFWSEDLEYDVETYLVVSCSCTSVCDCACSDLLYMLEYLKSLNPSYLVSAREKAPSTGHEHIHIYVQFPTSRALSIKKTLGAHIEKCKGSPQQNQQYVKKDGDIIDEIGELRRAGGATIKEIKKMEKIFI